MLFLKYPHIERYGHPDVAGLDAGTCHVFPKLDGTNASVWFLEGRAGCVQAGSRARHLTLEQDNAGFLAHVLADERLHAFTNDNPYLRLYGEWLVPHTFRRYRDEAWRKFWIFDAFDPDDGFLPWDIYSDLLARYELEVIPPLAVIKNPTESDLLRLVESNTFLVQDGAGPGEGIVVKNYAWTNRHYCQPWLKLVRNEFKEKNRLAFGVPEPGAAFQVEAAIAEEFCTHSLVAKERSKIRLTLGDTPDECFPVSDREIEEEHRSKIIPRLLQTCYHCVVGEELWAALKKYKDPTINFKRLRQFVVAEVKKHAADLF